MPSGNREVLRYAVSQRVARDSNKRNAMVQTNAMMWQWIVFSVVSFGLVGFNILWNGSASYIVYRETTDSALHVQVYNASRETWTLMTEKYPSIKYRMNEDGTMVLQSPRSSDLEYNALDWRNDSIRYFVYSPSGGFNNQRGELEYALKLCKLFKRGLIVPMAARHTSLWQTYSALGLESLWPMDKLIDFHWLSRYGIDLVPLDMPLKAFLGELRKDHPDATIKRFELSDDHHVRTAKYSTVRNKLVMEASRAKAKILYFEGPFWARWFPKAEMEQVKQYVRYSKYMREFAIHIVEKSFNNSAYNAIHLRTGDYSDSLSNLPVRMAGEMKRKGFPTNKLVYIATLPTKKTKLFAPILEHFSNVRFVFQLDTDLVRGFRRIFPEGPIRNDMFGLIEQLICTNADKFIGTNISTFTKWIYHMRKNRDTSFPEAHASIQPSLQ